MELQNRFMNESYNNFLKSFGGFSLSVYLQLNTAVEVSIIKDLFAALAQLSIGVLTVITIIKTLKKNEK